MEWAGVIWLLATWALTQGLSSWMRRRRPPARVVTFLQVDLDGGDDTRVRGLVQIGIVPGRQFVDVLN